MRTPSHTAQHSSATALAETAPASSSRRCHRGSGVVPVIIALVVLALAILLVVALSPKKDTAGPSPADQVGVPAPSGAPASRSGPSPTVDQPLAAPLAPYEPAAPQPAAQVSLADLVEALRLQLTRKMRVGPTAGGGAAFGARWLEAPPLPTHEAELLAGRIADDAGPYALVLRAIAGRRFGEARSIIDAWFEAFPDAPPEHKAQMTIARADADYYGGRFAEAEQGYLQVLEYSDTFPRVRVSLAAAMMRRPGAAEGDKLDEAIAILEDLVMGGAEGGLSKGRSPELWSEVQTLLGLTYWARAKGDPDENLRRAIACFEACLEVRTRSLLPLDWARMKDLLGAAYQALQSGDRDANLRRSIAAYTDALEVITQENAPGLFLALQRSKGDALVALPGGGRNANLKAAVECYERALSIGRERVTPDAWAGVQSSLAAALAQLEDGNKTNNLFKAVRAYEAALEALDRYANPFEWAMTQHNMGLAYMAMPLGDRAGNLAQAIESLEAALEVFTVEAYPLEWAQANSNLAQAFHALPTGSRQENLGRAVECYRSALEVITPGRYPELHAHLVALLASAEGELSG